MAGDGLHLFSDDDETEAPEVAKPTEEVPEETQEKKEQFLIEEQRYLLFSIGDTVFSTKLMEIREVISMVDYQSVPNTKPHFLGMANIRGEVVGLLDACSMLGVQPLENQDKSAIIIFDTEHGALGIKVNEVYGVREIPLGSIDDLPQVDSVVPQKYMQGIAKLDDKLVAVVELRNLLSDEDMVLIKKVS
ncbi:MAG: chemotaxis protein CheW [Oligoflexales bacterium]